MCVRVCVCARTRTLLGGSVPRFPSSSGSAWRRSSVEGWRRWESTEFPALRLTSRRWRLPLIQVRSVSIPVSELFFSILLTVVSSVPQTTRMFQSWWGRWTWTPSLEHWSCISASCQSLSSLTSCTQTLLEASVSLSFHAKFGCKSWGRDAHVHFVFSLAALSDSVAKESCMLNLLLSLPEPNLVTFLFLLDHLKR